MNIYKTELKQEFKKDIFISYMTKKELNELKNTLIKRGFTERTGGGN